MQLFSYFENVPELDIEREFQMIKLWERWHWELGLETFVLREFHARKHPHFAEYEAAIKQLPSVNPRAYETACWMRWLAMVQHCGDGGGILMDYDNFLIVPNAAVPAWYNAGKCVLPKLTVCQNVVPSLVVGSGAHYEWACKMFIKLASELPAGSKHASDMYFLEDIALKEPDAYTRLRTVAQYGEPDWQSGAAVHFAHSSFPSGTKRASLIPQLLSACLLQAEKNKGATSGGTTAEIECS